MNVLTCQWYKYRHKREQIFNKNFLIPTEKIRIQSKNTKEINEMKCNEKLKMKFLFDFKRTIGEQL